MSEDKKKVYGYVDDATYKTVVQLHIDREWSMMKATSYLILRGIELEKIAHDRKRQGKNNLRR